ncbi:glycosyltransferase family 2 protein [Nocardioides daphniae]|uniref:Glycosyltransferase family 2 protein n=1 Tax=Nocardioides daphniae TaxID=402297 RepID=A0A4P7UAV6_9ACTN|nr:glycosyltransferase [Nocardioides daphniae]QCC76405.1 glycosyltransferase family 2 protein [Nocardioides daphniae]GGD07126.1 hypothetical protein GCM10007231_02340 [Nocardioides daphniae]
MKTVVAVVFYSGLDDLDQCLKSIASESAAEARVVDTSPGQSAVELCLRHGAIHIAAPRNAGYAWALHQGFDSVPDEQFVFVCSNSDVVYQSGSLAELSALAARDESIVYPMQLTTPHGPVAPHIALTTFSPRSLLARWIGLGWKRGLRRQTHFVSQLSAQDGRFVPFPPEFGGSGAVIAMTAETWRRLDGLDRRFFLYEEDRALSLSARHLGISVGLALKARVVHAGGVMTRGLDFQTLDEAMTSERLLWEREFPGTGHLLIAVQRLGVGLRWIRALLRRRPEERRMYAALHRTLWRRDLLSSVPREADGFRRPRNYAFNPSEASRS